MQTCLQLLGRNRLYGAVKFPSPISDFLPTCAQAIPVLRFGRRFVSALLPDGSVQAWVHGVRADRRPPLRKRKNSAKIFPRFFLRKIFCVSTCFPVGCAAWAFSWSKKVRKKSGKNLEVKKKCVSLQSLSETGVTESGGLGFPGRRKRSLTRLRKYKNNKVPRIGKRLTRALIPSRNEQQSGSLRDI